MKEIKDLADFEKIDVIEQLLDVADDYDLCKKCCYPFEKISMDSGVCSDCILEAKRDEMSEQAQMNEAMNGINFSN